MLKKILFLATVVLFAVVPPIRADAATSANYGTNGSVGFTGKYESPPTTNKLSPKDQAQLPKANSTKTSTKATTQESPAIPSAGDSNNTIYLILSSGLVVLALLVTAKFVKDKKMLKTI
ncbi:hypothetical protein ACFO26_05110 [Lactococcus nasutitermitis]|uniref:Gram-positive cocci surface proteins LPxTG domain-containing protein n=1 Tax=Lactococcus nasutitermitis TaxID=1652957 RepID=A0ABV9JDA8_9LACT|nr:hypothetical protein [Lactococcus nasutitermitis]